MKIILFVISVLALFRVQDAAKIQSRIVGPEVPTGETHKYTAAILDGNYKTICSGVLIGRRFVLTAASCLAEHWDSGDLSVSFMIRQNGIIPGNTIYVAKKYSHESFNPRNRVHDIALLKLEELVDRQYETLSIPEKNENWIGLQGTLRGYGLRSPTDQETPGKILQSQRTVNIVDLSYCRKYTSVNSNNLCSTTSSACLGDQGAPLVVGDNFRLIGIVSESRQMVIDCNGGVFPVTVYTNVVLYNKWIQNTMNKM